MSANRANVLKVVELGLQDRVYEEMKKPKFSVEAFTRKINSEGIKITAQSIRKFIKNTKEAQRELISRDINAAAEIKKVAMDYGKELKTILTEVQDVKEEARQNKDMATYNQLIGRIMQGIELIAKLTGDIQPKGSTKVDINIIYNEINDSIEESMKHVRQELFKKDVIDVDADIVIDDKKWAEEIVE